MRNLILIILCSLSYVSVAQTFTPWEQHPNYDYETRLSVYADNDCSVIAFAIACDIPYHRSYFIHKNFFERKTPRSVTEAKPFWNNISDALRSLHLMGEIVHRPTDSTITVQELVAQHMDAFMYIVIDEHALASVNGTIFNQAAEPCLDCEVHAAFEVLRTPPCGE